jgi:peroxiredoxin
MTVREGDVAPGFTLPMAPGEEVDLDEHLGREPVVLLFFPLAFSPVCTTELCAFADRWDELQELDARFFAVSVDSPFVTARFRENEGIPFPVLSDFNRDVSETYGVLYEELLGLHEVAKRAVFVIGEDGTVMYRWVTEDPGVEPDYDAVEGALRRARTPRSA